MKPIEISNFIFHANQSLSDFSTEEPGKFKSKKEAEEKLEKNNLILADLQEKLYADNRHGLLIILQAMDAAGKDGIIKHVMNNVNPQGCQVRSFKKPSSEELDHDYMWRCTKYLPERGNIAIFNRSYYEEALVCRVHPELLKYQNLPVEHINTEKFWNERYQQMVNFEKYLVENGIHVLKFFLYLSKEEQKKRFLERLENSEKNWKFSASDIEERKYWEKYMEAYELMLKNTSSDHASWYVIPADKKYFSRLLVSEIIINKLNSLNLRYPELSENEKYKIQEAIKILKNE